MKRDSKVRTESDTKASEVRAKVKLLLEQAHMTELNGDEEIASLYYRKAEELLSKNPLG